MIKVNAFKPPSSIWFNARVSFWKYTVTFSSDSLKVTFVSTASSAYGPSEKIYVNLQDVQMKSYEINSSFVPL